MFIFRRNIKRTIKMNNVETRVLFDQHGTYKKPVIGEVTCIQQPLTARQLDTLLDPKTDWDQLARENIEPIKRWSSRSPLFPRVIPAEFGNFFMSTYRYSIRKEQEEGLVGIARDGTAKSTMISAAYESHGGWMWWGMGKSGRESVDPNMQMILSKQTGYDKLMFVKMIEIGYMLRCLDLLPQQREGFGRTVFLIDDDPNVARIASRLYQILCFVPITAAQARKYLDFPLSDRLRGLPENVRIGQGLPEARQLLRERYGLDDGIRINNRVPPGAIAGTA